MGLISCAYFPLLGLRRGWRMVQDDLGEELMKRVPLGNYII